MDAVLLLLGLILATMTLLSMLHIAHGLVRVCDFPRQQILTLSAAGIAASAILASGQAVYWLCAIFGAVVAVQAVFIIKFTPLWKAQSARRGSGDRDGAQFRLLAANVKQSNRRTDRLRGHIREYGPDLLVLLEVDEAWLKALRPELDGYPHTVEQPRSNSYGMLLASRFPLNDAAVRDLVTRDVPSITCTVELAEDKAFRLYCIHPEPPVPYADSVGRDAELSLVARAAADETIPVIVAGDLNDVGWSSTTRRFQRLSGMLDPRVGRGFFNTFDARYPFLRWPLDHLFHTAEFRLVSIRRLAPIGSDHFPILFDLFLTDRQKAEAEVEDADAEDRERAAELVGKSTRDREPVGSDWED